MKGPLGNIMKQAQEMQEKLKTAQESLASVEVTGASGGGLVEIVMTCRYDVRRVSIDDALASDDKEVLEDLIAAAVNDAVRRVEQVTQEKMGGLTSGINIPGLNIPGMNGYRGSNRAPEGGAATPSGSRSQNRWPNGFSPFGA